MMGEVIWRSLNRGFSLCFISMPPQDFFGFECRHHKRTANSSGTTHHMAAMDLPLPPPTIFRLSLYFFLKFLFSLRERAASGLQSQGDGSELWCKMEGALQLYAADQTCQGQMGETYDFSKSFEPLWT